MRRRIKKRVYVAIAILIIVIVILCRACSAITKDHTNETRTTTTTSVTTSTAEAEEVKQEEAEDKRKIETTVKEAENVEVEETVSSEAEVETEEVRQFTVDDPEATDVIAYLGERPVNMQELPTFDSYVKSQEKAFIIEYKGTNHWENNDARRLYFKVPIEEIVEEYEDDGQIMEKTVKIEEIEPGLIRATPIHGTEGRSYVTFKINSDGKTYYMTWVAPPIE